MKLKCILLIDDDGDDNFFHERAIRAINATEEIVVASNGFDALDLLKKRTRHPDLILLDVNMPKMTGWEFLNEYNKHFSDATSSIIVLSTSLNPDERLKVSHISQIKDYMAKPLDSDMMQDILRRFFSDQGAA